MSRYLWFCLRACVCVCVACVSKCVCGSVGMQACLCVSMCVSLCLRVSVSVFLCAFVRICAPLCACVSFVYAVFPKYIQQWMSEETSYEKSPPHTLAAMTKGPACVWAGLLAARRQGETRCACVQGAKAKSENGQSDFKPAF